MQAYSPYLAGLAARHPALATRADVEAAFAEILQDMAAEVAAATTTDTLMRSLRIGKQKAALVTGLADLRGDWDDTAVMEKLSAFADAAVAAALSFLLAEAHHKKTLRLPRPADPLHNCGVVVVALGKWGAAELNYSSDIDLMVVFDPQRKNMRDGDETQNFFIRLTRDLARIMEERTAEGYVFRTDLRLRPDPGAMPLAVSIHAAETYYGSLGQNWERAAMIKARIVAGDDTLARDFTQLMTSWIWRRSLDFATIQDIHSIKRQINAAQGKKAAARGKNPSGKNFPGAAFLGMNVKLGHGGIREIEFFAQTQQLIYGGREPALRSPRTLAALQALCAGGHISAATRDALSASYLFLRHVEHRLQMQEDAQTHCLPATPADFDAVARFSGYADTAGFVRDLDHHTAAVKKAYGALFTESPSLSAAGNLVFTGVEDDPETLETLRSMGFETPEKVTAAVRGWHHGRYRAVRSEKARQILTEITPHLLATLGRTHHPDDAFLRFDAFLSRLPSGVPIFSMFAHNSGQLELVADIMGTSPALAEYLGTHPNVLDGVLSRDFFGSLPDLPSLRRDLDRLLATARDYQDVLDIARRFAREKRFHAGIHILKNLSPQAACSAYLADIAEAALTCLLPHVTADFARQHGTFPDGELMILAMGSFAGREMYADSDLDIVGIYRTRGRAKQSTGAKPLPPNHYYIRLMQRLIAALSAPTAEGVLYVADSRLRPSGNDGPLAVSFDAFFDYQRNSAWTWEHMCLIRARLVQATDDNRRDFAAEVAAVLTAPRDLQKTRQDVLDMRARIEKQFGGKDPWNLKYRAGGIIDVMFVAQFLILQHAGDKGGKQLLQANIPAALSALAAHGALRPADHTVLATAYAQAVAVQALLRLAAETPFNPQTAPEGLKRALVARLHPRAPKTGFAACATSLEKLYRQSRTVYDRLLGEDKKASKTSAKKKQRKTR